MDRNARRLARLAPRDGWLRCLRAPVATGAILVFATLGGLGVSPARASAPIVRYLVVYSDTMTSAVLSLPLRSSDVLVVSSGSGNVAWINQTIRRLAPTRLAIIVQTKGLANLARVAAGTVGATGFSYDYEPDPAIPEFSWDSRRTKTDFAQAQRLGATLASPTGRPILEADLAPYRWNYPALLAGFRSPSLVQTQCWLHAGRFAEALRSLPSTAHGARFVPEISIASHSNGVPVTTAIAATRLAQRMGITAVFVWWDRTAQLRAFLAGT
jgi:hypothetical protein